MLVSTTFALIVEINKKADLKFQERLELQHIIYIHYLIQFNGFPVKMLMSSSSEVNAIYLSFMKRLSLRICKTDVRTEKINSSLPETYNMIITLYHMNDRDKKSCFIKKTFLLAGISMVVLFEMLFLTLSNIEIIFNKQELG